MIEFSLEAIGERLRTQDNRMTAHPLFEVQEQKRVYGIDVNYDPQIAWMHSDESIELSPEDSAVAEAFYQKRSEEPIEIIDGLAVRKHWRAPGDRVADTLRRVGFHEYWEYVQPFFTEAGAQHYIKQNGHNHKGKLRIYAGSAFRNWEWQAMREFLSSQGCGIATAAGKSE